MTKKELQQAIDQFKWFHQIDLPYRDPYPGRAGFITTPGTVDHCTDELANKRFGIPDHLQGYRVLDVGAWDGYFSFLAERRFAKEITAIDPMNGCSNMKQMPDTFRLAAEALGSRVRFLRTSLTGYAASTLDAPYDIVFYFGVLYHIDSPLTELEALAQATAPGGFALIETALSTRMLLAAKAAMWEFKPGHANDPTNKWYPSLPGLFKMLEYVGFRDVKMIHISRDNTRATFKAYK